MSRMTGRTRGEGSASRPCRRGSHRWCQSSECECNCHIPVTVHVREAMAIGEFLDPPQPGILLGDCSCGVTYTATRAQDGDEYGPLEAAHAAHVEQIARDERRPPMTRQHRCKNCGDPIIRSQAVIGSWISTAVPVPKIGQAGKRPGICYAPGGGNGAAHEPEEA